MNMTNRTIYKRVQTSYDLERMHRTRVFGVGGGGARQHYEDLARCGVGQFVLIDHDVVGEENIATQQVYLEEVGRAKVDCIADRILQINPDAWVEVYQKPLDEIDDDSFFRLAFGPFLWGAGMARSSGRQSHI
jgi:tRNA A37 threonylcarbamoyladenosine dehydratase